MSSDSQSTAEGQRDYLARVRKEIGQLDAYSPPLLRWHRWTQGFVISCGAAVPVLAAWSAVPRPVIGAVGALAAVVGGIAQGRQFQARAMAAMKRQSELERDLNLFLFSAGPYAERRTFPQFVDRIEEIRATTGDTFLATLQKQHTPPALEEREGSSPAR